MRIGMNRIMGHVLCGIAIQYGDSAAVMGCY